MTPFLKQVAVHYFGAGGLDTRCFVFPNRRSLLFFRKYLSESVAEAGQPMMAPEMCTINDLFYRLSGFVPADRVTLLIELYGCYRRLFPAAEPLDEFIYWGDMILADFNDTDKYLADPKALFANVAEYHETDDDLSHLSPEQRKAVELFLSHFRNLKTARSEDGIKRNFLQLWNLLYDLYRTFNERLMATGLSYEGMVFRHLARRTENTPVVDLIAEKYGDRRFVFVGLNALNECEKTLLRKMRNAGVAEFCWDYCSAQIRDPRNKSSFFLSANVEAFPQAFPLEDIGSAVPEIHVVNVPSAVGQVKYLPEILAETPRPGTDFAIVLPDEGLLPYLLNTLPPEIRDINVTMGYPVTGSECYSLLMDLIQLQLQLRRKPEDCYFHHKAVWSLMGNSLFLNALDEEDRKVAAAVKAGLKPYLPTADFAASPLLSQVFRPVVRDNAARDAAQIAALRDYLREMLRLFAGRIPRTGRLVHETDCAMLAYTCLGKLGEHPVEILPKTFKILLSRLLSGQDVHFRGEPLKGLQIMGPLETRSLDFRRIVLLSCNEGSFPRTSVSSSFIPAELRKGFGLPTYEYQDAVWAYYFYRLIQRAEKVWLLTDSRHTGSQVGEESRYIRQLEYHFKFPLHRHVVHTGPARSGNGTADGVAKPDGLAETLRRMRLSASAVKTYLHCPAKFYYSRICRLSDEDEVVENLDSRLLGTVYHAVMQALYLGEPALDPAFSLMREDLRKAVETGFRPLETVTAAWIDRCLSQEFFPVVRAKIRAEILKQLNTVEVKGRNLVTEDIIGQYVRRTLEQDRQLLRKKGRDAFRLLGLEMEGSWQLGDYTFYGYIDRLDSFEEDTVRVVDYKTGRVTPEEADIGMNNYLRTVTDLFTPGATGKKDIAVQIFLYDRFVRSAPEYRHFGNLLNSIYPVADLFRHDIVETPMCPPFNAAMEKGLLAMLAEIADPSLPFARTEVRKECEWCEFKKICGR